jgi:hypothetical protein
MMVLTVKATPYINEEAPMGLFTPRRFTVPGTENYECKVYLVVLFFLPRQETKPAEGNKGIIYLQSQNIAPGNGT